MRQTARVVVTLGCNRKCPGSCNNQPPEHKVVHSDEKLV